MKLQQQPRAVRRFILMPLGLLFIGIGAAATWFLCIVPLMHWQAAQTWEATPCKILSSSVGSHRGSKGGTTYSIDIVYRYECRGAEYQSDRYNFDMGSSSGYEGKAAVVERYPAGTEAQCYVDPQDPSWAVLSRDFSWIYLLPGLFTLFIIFGVIMLFSRGSTTPPVHIPGLVVTESPSATAAFAPVPEVTGAPRILESTISPRKTLVSSLVFTVAWYAILGAVGFGFLHDEGFSWSNAIPLAIVSFMALAGLLGVAGVVKGFLGLWNPRVRLEIAPGQFQLGGQVALRWTLEGDTRRVESLKMYLQGKESATYRRGTTTSTDHVVFEKIMIAEATAQADLQAGRVGFAMPEFTMHSLDLPNNKITWVLRVEGSIPRWPDIEEEFPVEVFPLPASGVRGGAA